MMKNLRRPNLIVKVKQRGVALVVSLIILLLMTIIGLSIMNGNRYFEKNAGNSRDKQRAIQAAQDALLYGEWWLVNGGGNLDFVLNCTSVPTTMQVCKTDPGPNPANLSSIQWYTKYTPALMTVQTAGNSTNGGMADTTSATSDVIYAQNPGIYINCITCTPLASGPTLYRITAIGYGGIGGGNGTVAIVQSVFASAGPTAIVPPTFGGPNSF